MPRSSRLRLPPDSITDDLALRWPRLNLVERGQELNKILDVGFSRRALAQALGCSEGAVRRYLKLAHLPPSTRDAIAGGQSAKLVLNAQRRGDPLPELDICVAQRNAEQRLVDLCMEEAGSWLRRHLPWPSYQEQFWAEADRRLWRRPICKTQIHPSSPRLKIRHHRPRRSAPGYGPDLLEYLLEWFLPWATEVLASPELRDRLLRGCRSQCRATIA